MNCLVRKHIAKGLSVFCIFYAPFCLAESKVSTSYNLGMVAPMTGDFAPYGKYMKEGADLALEDLAKRDIHAHLIVEDACLPTQVLTALTKLTSQDKISALIGSYCVIGIVASASILEKSKVVGFQTSGGTKEILSANDYLFTTAAKTTDEATSLAEHAYKILGARKVSILYLTTQWGEEFSQAFAKTFSSLGGTITGVATNPIGQNDFRAELTKLRGGNPDTLLIIHLASTLGIAIKEARQLGFKGQFLATEDAEEDSAIKEAGVNAEGLTLLAAEPKVETAAMKSFDSEYFKRFGHSPHPLARHSYDSTMLAVESLVKCDGNSECAKNRIYEIKDYQGATGIISINNDGGTDRTFVAKTVHDGKFIIAP